MNIRDFICAGEGNARTRAELCMMTGLNDRELRLAIQRENEKGEKPIINLGTGYFIPTNNEQILAYRNTEVARARTIEKKIRTIDKYLEYQDQMEIAL